MRRKKSQWKKAAAAVLAAAMVLQNGFSITAGRALAQEETEGMELRKLTAPVLRTEDGSAFSARLRIGDWLDYGDYEIERADIPGTAYFFYITTQDMDGTVINDDQLAYCIQSYFLTPLPGDHSDDMTDQVSAVGDKKNLHKVIYYGYGGEGYEADEFVAFLVQTDAEYYKNVYTALSESEQAELCYILTHAAASYAYFTDGTPFDEYIRLQFELKYGETWEEELIHFTEQELEKAKITDGDMNLFGATYGMNPAGIALTKGWYQLLSSKKEPGLSVTANDGVYTFYGNERNDELELTFDVPDGFSCTMLRSGGEAENVPEGTEVTVRPEESFAFTFTDEAVSSEPGGISELTVPVEGTLSGAEQEVWNLVLLQTNKGTDTTIVKRQQDIAAVSMLDAGRTELSFAIEMQKGSVSVTLTDDTNQAVQGAEFGVYYDEGCSKPVQQDGEAVRMITGSKGDAYLECVINQELQENGGRLYVKMLTAPTGYLMDEEVHCIEIDQNAASMAERETTSVSGAVSWKVPEGTVLPKEVSVELQQDDETVDTKIVTADDDWSYEWDQLPRYCTETDGSAAEYKYGIEIAPIEGYDTMVDGYDAINTITGETSVSGQVIWHDHDDADGLRPESLTIDLYRSQYLPDPEHDGEQESVTENLHREDVPVDSVQISEADDWKYSFDGLDRYSVDGKEEYVYTVGAQVPEEYTFEPEGDQLVGTHTASASVDIEGIVNLNGGDLKDGEYSFELTQVTDETGETEVENGIHRTAVNDLDGKVVFPDIICTEPGTYYFRITEITAPAGDEGILEQMEDERTAAPTEDEETLVETEDEGTMASAEDEETRVPAGDERTTMLMEDEETSVQTEDGETRVLVGDEGTPIQADEKEALKAAAYIAKVEVTVGGENMDQLEAEVTYPNGQPEFEHVYTVSDMETETEVWDEDSESETEMKTEAENTENIEDTESEDTESENMESEDTESKNAESESTENTEAKHSTVIPFLILMIIIVFIIFIWRNRHRK